MSHEPRYSRADEQTVAREFPCSCGPEYRDRDLHYGNCPAQYWDDVTDLIAVIRADERAKVRAELLGCVTCGLIHEPRAVGIWHTWASPVDGHLYRRRSLDDLTDRMAKDTP